MNFKLTIDPALWELIKTHVDPDYPIIERSTKYVRKSTGDIEVNSNRWAIPLCIRTWSLEKLDNFLHHISRCFGMSPGDRRLHTFVATYLDPQWYGQTDLIVGLDGLDGRGCVYKLYLDDGKSQFHGIDIRSAGGLALKTYVKVDLKELPETLISRIPEGLLIKVRIIYMAVAMDRDPVYHLILDTDVPLEVTGDHRKHLCRVVSLSTNTLCIYSRQKFTI